MGKRGESTYILTQERPWSMSFQMQTEVAQWTGLASRLCAVGRDLKVPLAPYLPSNSLVPWLFDRTPFGILLWRMFADAIKIQVLKTQRLSRWAWFNHANLLKGRRRRMTDSCWPPKRKELLVDRSRPRTPPWPTVSKKTDLGSTIKEITSAKHQWAPQLRASWFQPTDWATNPAKLQKGCSVTLHLGSWWPGM